MIRLAIIGVSGRDPQDLKRLNENLMKWMLDNVIIYIELVMKTVPKNIILVSGGSAWADHVAVQLYLTDMFAGLELYLPSKFDHKQKKYVNTHEGRTLNMLHSQCEKKTGFKVFDELTRAVLKKNTKITIKRGFKQRNTLVAKNCDYLIAYTFGKDLPKPGGTLHTWNKVTHKNKIHISLSFGESPTDKIAEK